MKQEIVTGKFSPNTFTQPTRGFIQKKMASHKKKETLTWKFGAQNYNELFLLHKHCSVHTDIFDLSKLQLQMK